ncbi:MAG: DUF2065 family protein [Gammaproteobacteria bacterium]|nr:MAG: DUF2065 family protein [Gammaproteobacteria bacterium]
MWDDLLAATALVLVFEGMLPFLSPRMYRQAVEQLARMPDGFLRRFGLGLMLAGLALLYIVRH